MTFWGWLKIVGAFTVLLYVGMDYVTAEQRDDAIASCERASLDREADLFLAESLVKVNERRVDAEGSTQSEIDANEYAIRRYTRAKNKKIEAQAPVAIEPGSVKADCSGKSYPDPVPWGIFS